MRKFESNYQNIIDAAMNQRAPRLPLYEHGISGKVIEKITGIDYLAQAENLALPLKTQIDGFVKYCEFAQTYGYDVIPYEYCLTMCVQEGAGLMGTAPGIIQSQSDFDRYDFDALVKRYIANAAPRLDALRAAMPENMKAVGGVGNGVFETVQDFVTFHALPFMQMDDPELYSAIWKKVGEVEFSAWKWLLDHYADLFAVCRFGDDLGFRSSTLLAPADIRENILPQYKKLVALIHSYGKPFLLHSCGKIYEVMEELIDEVKIDAKHSNEDAIDSFDIWVERYGDRIGNFGGVEMNVLCLNTPEEVRKYVLNICEKVDGKGGIAIGSGNQIAEYVKPECFIAMTRAVREYRGESL